MTRPASSLALCAALPVEAGEGAPEWVMLLPAGEARTVDGRGPYRTQSMGDLATALNSAGKKLPIDECHAIDLAAKLGAPAPARAWMTSFEVRDGALWARTEWTPTGAQLMAEKAYVGLSPVVRHTKDKVITDVLRASLTNTPNLTGLVALHSEETSMDWKAMLIELLGLDSAADDAAIKAALEGKMTAVAPQSENLLEHPAVVALQSEVASLTTKLNGMTEGQARKDATAFVDAAIAEGRVGLKPVRDEYIALHMSDADKAQKLIAAMPKLSGSLVEGDPPVADANALTAEDRQVMALFNMSEEDYRAQQAALGMKKEAL